MKTVPIARLRELLDYNPKTGIFTRKVKVSQNTKVGCIAGTKNEGYVAIRIDGVRYQAHRLAVAYVEGVFPLGQIDHKNGDQFDNSYSNLRHATHAENQQNRIVGVNNTSGYLGVTLIAKGNRWRASIRINKAPVHLGYFGTPEEAHAAYRAAKAQLHTFNPVPR